MLCTICYFRYSLTTLPKSLGNIWLGRYPEVRWWPGWWPRDTSGEEAPKQERRYDVVSEMGDAMATRPCRVLVHSFLNIFQRVLNNIWAFGTFTDSYPLFCASSERINRSKCLKADRNVHSGRFLIQLIER